MAAELINTEGEALGTQWNEVDQGGPGPENDTARIRECATNATAADGRTDFRRLAASPPPASPFSHCMGIKTSRLVTLLIGRLIIVRLAARGEGGEVELDNCASFN